MATLGFKGLTVKLMTDDYEIGRFYSLSVIGFRPPSHYAFTQCCW